MIRRILGLSRTRRRSTSNATQNIEGSSLNDDGVAARPSLDCLAIDLEDTIVTTSQGRATGSEGTAEASSTSSCRLQGPRISSTINSQHLARSNPRSPPTAVSRGRLRPKDQIKRLKGFGRQKSRKSAQGDAAEKGEEEAKGEGNAAAAAAEVKVPRHPRQELPPAMILLETRTSLIFSRPHLKKSNSKVPVSQQKRKQKRNQYLKKTRRPRKTRTRRKRSQRLKLTMEGMMWPCKKQCACAAKLCSRRQKLHTLCIKNMYLVVLLSFSSTS
mmetsp:Transcript_6315/g.10069  ORF Transcript_6315/g.10069 Transcript_6315/m.10069 type:complete len:272 (+) Transcript_6315:193-1008(+)